MRSRVSADLLQPFFLVACRFALAFTPETAADDVRNHWLISLPDPLPILDYSLLQHSAISLYLVVLVKRLCQTD